MNLCECVALPPQLILPSLPPAPLLLSLQPVPPPPLLLPLAPVLDMLSGLGCSGVRRRRRRACCGARLRACAASQTPAACHGFVPPGPPGPQVLLCLPGVHLPCCDGGLCPHTPASLVLP